MQIGSTTILDTFAEAFGMRFTRLIVTADDDFWRDAAVREATGYSASVIACDAETGIERPLTPEETPDGRPGTALLMFAFTGEALAKAVAGRVGQCVMTCPTTACFNGLPGAEATVPLGKHLRYFGDGYQKSKKLADQRYWRIPVMDGEFVVEESVGTLSYKGIRRQEHFRRLEERPTPSVRCKGWSHLFRGVSSAVEVRSGRSTRNSLRRQLTPIARPSAGASIQSWSKVPTAHTKSSSTVSTRRPWPTR